MTKKILLVFGTRPEAIKMAPLVKEFQKHPETFDTRVCVTAQHREMLDQVLDFFDISPQYDLDLMQPGQNLYSLTAAIITGMKPVLESFNPDYVFVHGDTSTTMATSIAAFYNQSKVCHVEAGLRTHDKWSPFPEEINRQVTGRIADFHFAPTATSQENLRKENVHDAQVVITGNTVIDALLESVDKVEKNPTAFVNKMKDELGNSPMILVTGHRRENHGQGFENICQALLQIAQAKPDYKIVYPVHLNPKVQEPVNRLLSNVTNIKLIDPLDYPDFIWMMSRSTMIITDSGGVQEEAPSLGKPVLVMRDTTERPEAVDEGTVILVGTDVDLIVKETLDLLNDKERFTMMSKLHNPYGDGKACARIVKTILKDEIKNG